MKRLMGVLAALAMLVLPVAFAAPVGASVTGTHDNGSYTAPTAGGDLGTIAAGHIYEANISYQKSTEHWAGIYGTITESIVLSDGSNTFFTWSGNLDATAVYLSNNQNVDWTGSFIGDLTTQDINDMGIWNEATTSFADNLENTAEGSVAAGTAPCDFIDSTLSITGNLAYVQTEDNAGNKVWTTCYFAWDGDGSGAIDGTSDAIVVAGNVGNNPAYNGNPANYQVLVPTNNSGLPYYVWVE